MIARARPGGHVLMTHAHHAALTTRLLGCWGAGAFAPPPPALLRAATLHEEALREDDTRPRLDPGTRLPRDYRAIPWDEHLALWRGAAARLARDPAAALLVSRHGTWIFRRYEAPPATPGARDALAAYLTEERALQRALAGRARAAGEAWATPGELRAASALLAAADRISAHLCFGEAPSHDWPAPDCDLGTPLRLERTGPETWALDPWPLRRGQLRLRGEGRLLEGLAPSQGWLDARWKGLPLVRWTMALRPARGPDGGP